MKLWQEGIVFAFFGIIGAAIIASGIESLETDDWTASFLAVIGGMLLALVLDILFQLFIVHEGK